VLELGSSIQIASDKPASIPLIRTVIDETGVQAWKTPEQW
jgi:hypothetical protein